jgi:hypothetical protein
MRAAYTPATQDDVLEPGDEAAEIGMELEYVTSPYGVREDARFARRCAWELLVLVTVMTIAGLVLARVARASWPFVLAGGLWALVELSAVRLPLVTEEPYAPWRRAWSRLARGVVARMTGRLLIVGSIWMIAATVAVMSGGPYGPTVAASLAIIGLAVFADRVATHAVCAGIANSRLNRDTRRALTDQWNARLATGARAEDAARRAAGSSARLRQAGCSVKAYRRRLGVTAVGAPVFAAMILAAAPAVLMAFVGAGGAALWLAPLAIAAGWSWRRYGRAGGLRVVEVFAVLRDFCAYNRHGTTAPGVFRSPAGDWSRRLLTTYAGSGACCAFLALAMVLSASATRPDAGLGSRVLLVLPAVLLAAVTALGIVTLAIAAILPFVRSLAGEALVGQTETARAMARRLVESAHPLEREHLLIGFHVLRDAPVLLSRRVLAGGAHVLGAIGSGKTHRGALPIAAQLLAQGAGSVLFLDLKGDPSACRLLRGVAQSAGVRFRGLTLDERARTCTFKPLHQGPQNSTLALAHGAAFFTQAMSLSNGRTYPVQFWSEQATEFLKHTLELLPSPSTFAELQAALEYEGRSRFGGQLWDNGAAARGAISHLSDYPALNVADPLAESAINVVDLLRQPEALYFRLESTTDQRTAGDVALLALFTLIGAASALGPEQRKTPVYVVLDEFQNAVGHNITIVLQQARSLGIHVLLAHQSHGDLAGIGLDVAANVNENTAFKLYFSIIDHELQDQVLRTAGLIDLPEISVVTGTDRPSMKIGTREAGRYTPNELNIVTATPGVALARILRSDGFTRYQGEWFRVRCPFHFTIAEVEAAERSGWPDDLPGAVRLSRPAAEARPRVAPPRDPAPPQSLEEVLERFAM